MEREQELIATAVRELTPLATPDDIVPSTRGPTGHSPKRTEGPRDIVVIPPEDITVHVDASSNPAEQPVPPAQQSNMAWKYVHSKSYKLSNDFISSVLKNDLYVLRITRTASKNSGNSHYYVAFSTIDNLCTYYSCYQSELSRYLISLDEVCISDVQKPKIDFDAKRSDFNTVSADFSTGDHVTVLSKLRKTFALSIAKKYDMSLSNLLPYVKIYSSCRKDKVRFHLVSKSIAATRSDCKKLAHEAALALEKVVPGYSKFIDTQVYSTKQSFRVLGSCKFNELQTSDVVKTECKLVGSELVNCLTDEYDHEPLLQSLVTCVDDLRFMSEENTMYPDDANVQKKKIMLILWLRSYLNLPLKKSMCNMRWMTW